MADISSGGYFGNATDGIGQGLAYVLPQSNTERYAMQLAQQHAADLKAQAAQQQAAQQQQEAEYQKQLLAQKIPDYWAKVGQNINNNYNQWLQDAATYHANTGKSPFDNPDFIQRYNNDVLLPARQSKDLQATYTQGLAKVAADHDNRLTDPSKQAFTQWAQGVDADPYSYLNKPAPQLLGTPSGLNDILKLVKPVKATNDNGTLTTVVPDTNAMQTQAYGLFNDPRWNNLKANNYKINPDLGDIGVIYNKQGQREWHTDPTFTADWADQKLANPNAPENAIIFAKTGISPNDPYAKEKLQEVVRKQNQGYNLFNKDVGDYGNSLVSHERKYQPDKFYEHEAWLRAHPEEKPKQQDTVVLGNQGSMVPTLKTSFINGKQVPTIVGYEKDSNGNPTDKPIFANSTTEAEKGASLFSSNFDNQSVTVSPSNYVNLKSGHSIKNTEPFNMQVGTIKMVPVFKDLDGNDSRNGAEISLRQLKEIVDGKSKNFNPSNIEFKPYAYGTRSIKDEKGHSHSEGISIPADAIMGNKKIPTDNLNKAIQGFQQISESPQYKAYSPKQKLDFLMQYYNIQ